MLCFMRLHVCERVQWGNVGVEWYACDKSRKVLIEYHALLISSKKRIMYRMKVISRNKSKSRPWNIQITCIPFHSFKVYPITVLVNARNDLLMILKFLSHKINEFLIFLFTFRIIITIEIIFETLWYFVNDFKREIKKENRRFCLY